MSHLPAGAGGMETRAIDANLEADASRRKRSGAITPGETVTGWVAKVTDGDGLLVNVAGRGQFAVRLAYVDAPEFDQPGGKEAKDALRKLAFQGRRGGVERRTDPQRGAGEERPRVGRSAFCGWRGETKVQGARERSEGSTSGAVEHWGSTGCPVGLAKNRADSGNSNSVP